MIWAIATLLAWTLSGFGSARAAAWWGSFVSNRWRLLGASLILLIWQLLAGWPAHWPGLWWFLLGGLLHLGLGDIALYACYRLLGPRLGVLICVCLAPPLAGLLEWLLLGTTLRLGEVLVALGILSAVGLALAPRERLTLGMPAIRAGVICGIAAAALQAAGAVVTRSGYADCAAIGHELSPFTGALLRSVGGLAVLLPLAFWRADVAANYANKTGKLAERSATKTEQGPWVWLALSTFAGPVFGIAAYHAALEQAPAALVQAVIAALPVTMIPLAWLLDGDRPSRRSAIGALLAVGLVSLLALLAQYR